MGLPWLTYPLLAYNYREPPACELTPEQCAFQSSLFRNWYVADLVYGRGTIYFFLITLLLCLTGFRALKHTPPALRSRAAWHKTVAVFRFWAYRQYRLPGAWPGTGTGTATTPPLGVLLLLGLGAAFFALMTLAPQPYYWPTTAAFGDSPPLATRAGWLALAPIPFVILLATKANMIGALTGVSHERLMVFHTWLAWAVFVLALIHTFPFIVYNASQNMSAEMWASMSYYWTGVIALVAQAYMTFMSVPWLRNKCYEFFKATHYFMAIVFMVFLFLHCAFTLSSVDYFIVAGTLYAASWSYSQMKTYFDHGIRRRATLTALSPTLLRIDIPVGALTLWTPGQHMFLRFLGGGLGLRHMLTAHPFTICSLPDADKLVGEPQSVMTFYVKPRGGFTGRLAAAAAAATAAGRRVVVPVLLEGAYGGVQGRPMTEYDRTLVIACGSGAGFSLPFVMEHIAAAAAAARCAGGDDNKTTAAGRSRKKMTVVIATRDATLVQWYEAAIMEFLHQHMLEIPAPGLVDVVVHLTSSEAAAAAAQGGTPPPPPPGNNNNHNNNKRISSSSSSAITSTTTTARAHHGLGGMIQVQTTTGRPDLAAVVRQVTMQEQQQQQDDDTASVGIAVCGPAEVLRAVRREAAEAELRILRSGAGAREVYLHSEVFGW